MFDRGYFRTRQILCVLIISLTIAATAISNVSASAVVPAPVPTVPVPVPTEPVPVTTPVTPSVPAQVLTQVWRGAVPHLFFHPLITDPGAFKLRGIGPGFLDYFVTVGEFDRILIELYGRGFVLVDLHQAITPGLTLPVGKRPLVISIDDLNYYPYMRSAGLPSRLVLERAADGTETVTAQYGDGRTDRRADVVPILDDFVAAHPDFSFAGAKATINLTGFAGALGYDTRWRSGQAPAKANVAAARVIADGFGPRVGRSPRTRGVTSTWLTARLPTSVPMRNGGGATSEPSSARPTCTCIPTGHRFQ